MSVCPYAATEELPNGFIKFDTGEFHYNFLAHFNSGENQISITATLHEDLHAFLCSEVTGWRIPHQTCIIQIIHYTQIYGGIQYLGNFSY
jgi:hypothetical protein